MKTILYLHSSSDLYGSDRSLLRTVRGLDATRHRAVVCLPYDGPLAAALRESGATVYVLDLAIMRRKNFSFSGAIEFFFSQMLAAFRLSGIVRRHQIDLIHSNTTAVIGGGIVARLSGKPHIWHVREIVVSPVIVRKFIAWSLMHGATLVVGVSRSVIDNLSLDQAGIRDKSRVIHNGIQTSDFIHGKRGLLRRQLGILDETILVGMLGRVGSWKGQELLLEAAVLVRQTRPLLDVRFVAVGSAFQGQEEKLSQLRTLVLEKQLSECFSVIEFRTDVSDILAALDIFVLPSVLPDPFPTTVLEAMAARKPIVANGHGGVLEMLEEGKSGFLIFPNDAIQMAQRIALLSGDRDLRTSMGSAAQTRVKERFDVSTYRSTMNAVYDEMLDKDRK